LKSLKKYDLLKKDLQCSISFDLMVSEVEAKNKTERTTP